MTAPGAFFDPDVCRRIAAVVKAYEGGGLWNTETSDNKTALDRDFVRVPFKNSSGETAPQYGVMEIKPTPVTFGSDKVLAIQKVTNSLKRLYLVCGSPGGVADGKFGWGTFLFQADYVLFDANYDTPSSGQSFGVDPGSWKLRKDRPGFLMTGRTKGTGATSRGEGIQEVLTSVLAKNTSTVGTGSITATIVGGTPGSETDWGMTVASVKNLKSIPANKLYTVNWFNGYAYAAPFEC